MQQQTKGVYNMKKDFENMAILTVFCIFCNYCYESVVSNMSAYKKQVGGSHYKNFKIQPSQFINENRLPFAEGSAIKYICRHAAKGKKQDIDKAIHYLEMIKERDYV